MPVTDQAGDGILGNPKALGNITPQEHPRRWIKGDRVANLTASHRNLDTKRLELSD